MSLAEFADLGEAIGGLAVLMTVMYLAVQMRQSTDLARAAAQRDLMNSFNANLDRIARAPRIWQKGVLEFETLSNEDQLRFTMIFNTFVNHLEQTLRMLARGLETQDNVDIFGDICLALIREPGGRQVWEHTKPLYFRLSREYIERRLGDETGLPPRASEIMPWHAPDSAA